MMINDRSHQKRRLCLKRRLILLMRCRQLSSRTSRRYPREATRITETGTSTTKLLRQRPIAHLIKPLMSSMARGACAAPAAPNKHQMKNRRWSLSKFWRYWVKGRRAWSPCAALSKMEKKRLRRIMTLPLLSATGASHSSFLNKTEIRMTTPKPHLSLKTAWRAPSFWRSSTIGSTTTWPRRRKCAISAYRTSKTKIRSW